MKVKNIAFFGIMATILGVGGAYAANDTIIASKGYVDAKTQGLQNKNEREITLSSSNERYPTSGAVKTYVDDAVVAIDLSSRVPVDQEEGNKDKLMVTSSTGQVGPALEMTNITVKDSKVSVTGFDPAGSASAAETAAKSYADGLVTDMETQTHAAATYQPIGSYATANHNHDDKYELLSNKLKETTLEGKTLVEYMKDMTEEQKTAFLKDKYPSLAVLYEQALALDGKIPTKTSDLTNDSGYLTSVTHPIDNTQEINGVTKTDVLGFTQNTTTHAPSIDAVKNALTTKQLVYDTAMDSALKDINNPNANTNATCNAANPCVLTYNGDKYVWTNMDLGTNQ